MVRPSVHKFDNVSVATLYAEVEKIRLLFPKFIEIETGQEVWKWMNRKRSHCIRYLEVKNCLYIEKINYISLSECVYSN